MVGAGGVHKRPGSQNSRPVVRPSSSRAKCDSRLLGTSACCAVLRIREADVLII